MKVSVKDLQVKDMGLGNNGIEFDVYDNKNNHLGDLRINKTGMEWCSGRTRAGNGERKTWKELIAFFKSEED